MTTITNRDEYIKFRQEWRTTYKRLSATIRQLKVDIKNGMRRGVYMGNEQNRLLSSQSGATEMLLDLANVREQARQYHRSRQLEHA